MRLYFHPVSTCSRRVLMTAHHYAIDLELTLIDLAKGEQFAPDFMKLNPNHCVPVLEHDGFVLWESYAIMQYLANMAQDDQESPVSQGEKLPLYPHGLQARADVDRWLFWCGQDFMPGIATLNWENSIKQLIGNEPADPVEVARGERLLTDAAKILDAHLASREWVCDSGLSLVDFAIAAPLADQESAKLPITELPNLQRWFEQIKTLNVWLSTEPSNLMAEFL